jgi:PAS domain S-box-containing protein
MSPALLLAVCLAAFLAGSAHGMDPDRALSQYVRTRWGADQGFPRGPVYAIGQSSDGYLWIGAQAGLIRFDGFNFRLFRDVPGLPNGQSVLGLLPDGQGNLWIRTAASLLRYRNGVFDSPTQRLTSGITAMSRTNKGDLLISVMEQGAMAYHGTLQMVAAASDLPRSPVLAVADTRDNSIWFGTRDAGLFRVHDGRTSAVSDGLPDLKVNCLIADENGHLWIGTDNGIVRWDGSRLAPMPEPESFNQVQVLAIERDHDGNIWAGTDSRGVVRINHRGVSYLDPPAPRSPDAVTAFFEDREGNLWIGRANGIERLRDSPFRTYSVPEGLPTEGNNPVFVDSENRVWFPPAGGGLWWMKDGRHEKISNDGLDRDVVYSIAGSQGELWVARQRGGLTRLRINGSSVTARTYTTADGVAQNSVYSVYQARDGTIWAGTLSGGVTKFSGGRFTTYTSTTGLLSNTVASILEDTDGTMWFATSDGLNSLSQGRWQSYTEKDHLPSENVYCILEDSAKVLWVGTAAGLAFRDRHGIHTPGGASASLQEPILGIAEDKRGSLWIATSNRVLRVNRDKLLEGALNEDDVREYGVADGLRGSEAVRRHRAVAADPFGRIWFCMNRGISVVDPARLRPSSAPVIVHVQSMSADGSAIPVRVSVHIPGGSERITFAYAGLSLSAPELVRYRYRLEGYDSRWSDTVSGREASYTNLSPGQYRFRVVATNPDGAWNSTEGTLAFEVDPLLWQTWWFRAACVAAFLALLWALYQLRIRQLQYQERKLREAIETIPAMAFIARPDESIEFVNRRWVEYTGLTAAGAAGSGWQVAVHPEDLDSHLAKWRASLRSGEPFENEARFQRAVDGEYRWFLMRAVPLRDKRGNILKWYGVTTDIEDRKRAEQEHERLRELEAELAHINRVTTMGELTASLAHEIRQPIAAAITNANTCLRWLARDQPNLDEVREAAKRIVNDGTRAGEIISRLRSLYKKSPPERELVDVNELVREMLVLLRSEANRYSIPIRADLATGLPKIPADRVQLQQVLLNLMLNGIEAMSESGGELMVKSQVGEDGQLLISISDTGVGLPAEEPDQIFNAFFTTKPQGSGMGLAISRSIVESHGGRLWATANSGRGATFHFTLPTAAKVMEMPATGT